jgi:hypothetical protein
VRVDVFELEDRSWFPAALRRAITSYLGLVVRMTGQMRAVVPAIRDLLDRTDETRILDLCSGSGGIAAVIARELATSGRPVTVTLSDLYPDNAAMRDAVHQSGGLVDVHPRALDATRVPDTIGGLRTMFNAFHHFDAADARTILDAAARSGHPIAIVELLDKTPFGLAGVFFSPLLVFLVAPFLRPLRWTTLVLTYVVPIVPLVVFWDGFASWLRLYSLRDLERLSSGVGGHGYRWSAGRRRVGLVRITYLIGEPS